MIFLGQLIRDKRNEKGITQEWLNNHFNYSSSFFSKIESGTIDVPPNIISELSSLLDFDFKHIYMYSYMFETYEQYCLYFTLKKAIIRRDNQNIIPTILSDQNINEEYFETANKSELYYLLLQAYLLLQINNNDFDVTTKCYRFLQIDTETVDLKIIFDRQIPVLSILVVGLFENGNQDQAYQLSSKLLEYISNRIDNNYCSSEQYIDLYNMKLAILNNHAFLLYKLGSYNISLYYCDCGIDDSINFQLVHKSLLFYKLKLGNYYQLAQFDKAHDCINQIVNICDIIKSSFWTDIEKRMHNEYPKLFN